MVLGLPRASLLMMVDPTLRERLLLELTFSKLKSTPGLILQIGNNSGSTGKTMATYGPGRSRQFLCRLQLKAAAQSESAINVLQGPPVPQKPEAKPGPTAQRPKERVAYWPSYSTSRGRAISPRPCEPL